MPFPSKLEILATFLAGFQKAAQYCGNGRALAAEVEKKKTTKKLVPSLVSHSLMHSLHN